MGNKHIYPNRGSARSSDMGREVEPCKGLRKTSEREFGSILRCASEIEPHSFSMKHRARHIEGITRRPCVQKTRLVHLTWEEKLNLAKTCTRREKENLAASWDAQVKPSLVHLAWNTIWMASLDNHVFRRKDSLIRHEKQSWDLRELTQD